MNKQQQYSKEELLISWERIGKKNRWIAAATEPEFSAAQLTECHSVEELEYNLSLGNWNLGKGFYFQNLCLINQIDGGDEWLTIRDRIPFESMTVWRLIDDGDFIIVIEAMLEATDERLMSLNY
ncbi:hypothetical protein [Pedobacter frigoris]|uniref:hypothetical protein n=1 Tax=Pedobacter frigoris TaxID=2571272 RepID=UPI00292F8C34|nr:hypothetical protein [Pedobacter frigoris]